MADPFWVEAPERLLARLSSPEGLTDAEAAARLLRVGPNRPPVATPHPLRQLLAQLTSPLMLLLLGAAAISALAGEWSDAAIVLLIVGASGVLGFVQERRATVAIARLGVRVRAHTRVHRAGRTRPVPTDEVVPGDLVELGPGSLLPGDGVFLASNGCQVDEASLTGETFPVEKRPGAAAPGTPLGGRSGAGWTGTSVVSGTARFLVVTTGAGTELGQIARDLDVAAEPTSFERGVRDFGRLVTAAMAVLVVAVGIVLVASDRPVVEALLFAIALAVGLAPELLPAILTVNLARGARRMADRGVLVRRLAAIQDFGAMDVLCTDKTGTLTTGVVRLERAVDAEGRPDAGVRRLAVWNARLQQGLPNPLDAALAGLAEGEDGVRLVGEIPYDFVRKRLSVVVDGPEGRVMITKGAVEPVLAVCTTVDGRVLDEAGRAALRARFAGWCAEGHRVLAVARRRADHPGEPATEGGAGGPWTVGDEQALDFAGFLLFVDPPKDGLRPTLDALAGLGVRLKVVSGDNRHAVAWLARAVGLPDGPVLTGPEIDTLDDAALGPRADTTSLFAETTPLQKERVLRALRGQGGVVGYLGDGVNDAPPLHAADVGISVEGAVDVARAAADLVLVERDLRVLTEGILEGRRIFANTLKYVLTTESANLGNMVSMAATALFLPFLPLLPKQILLNNFLSDFPAIALASDRVDPEQLARPLRWDMRRIGSFMLVFGLVSALFDGVTFVVLLAGFDAGATRFQTGWFVESLLTELVVALVVRTRRPAWRSRPGAALVWSTVAVSVVALLLPSLPGAAWLGFEPLPPALYAALLGITAGYVALVELTKRGYERWVGGPAGA